MARAASPSRIEVRADAPADDIGRGVDGAWSADQPGVPAVLHERRLRQAGEEPLRQPAGAGPKGLRVNKRQGVVCAIRQRHAPEPRLVPGRDPGLGRKARPAPVGIDRERLGAGLLARSRRSAGASSGFRHEVGHERIAASLHLDGKAPSAPLLPPIQDPRGLEDRDAECAGAFDQSKVEGLPDRQRDPVRACLCAGEVRPPSPRRRCGWDGRANCRGRPRAPPPRAKVERRGSAIRRGGSAENPRARPARRRVRAAPCGRRRRILQDLRR